MWDIVDCHTKKSDGSIWPRRRHFTKRVLNQSAYLSIYLSIYPSIYLCTSFIIYIIYIPHISYIYIYIYIYIYKIYINE